MEITIVCWVGCVITLRLVMSEILIAKSNAVTYARSDGLLPSESDSRERRLERAILGPDKESTTYLTLHNDVRRLEGSSDMETLTYNAELAKMAKEWADKCDFVHGQPPRSPSELPYSSIGQNLYATTGNLNATSAIVDGWYGEKKYFNYDTLGCQSGQVCGHYTQVVWANSVQVGCAYSFCPSLGHTNFRNAMNFVCNYGPAGNYDGEKPYKKGTACSMCESGKSWCNRGLCNLNCKSSNSDCDCSGTCQNCGSMNYGSCTCSCRSGWHGSDCSVVCKDGHANCNANPGWPPTWCNHVDHGDYVRKNCPAMCGLCRVFNASEPQTCSSDRIKQSRFGLPLFVVALASLFSKLVDHPSYYI